MTLRRTLILVGTFSLACIALSVFGLTIESGTLLGIISLLGMGLLGVNVTDGEVAGLDCVMAYNTATHATPTWATMTRVQDVSVPQTKGEGEVTSRASAFAFTVDGLIRPQLEFGYMYRRGTDAVWTALKTSFYARSTIEIWAGDANITHVGAKGLRCYYVVTEFTYVQDLEGAMVYKVVMKPKPTWESSSLVEPDMYIIA